VGVLGCMITAPSRIKDIAREFIENHLLKRREPEDHLRRRAAGHAGQQGLLRRARADPRSRATMANARAGEPIPNIPEMGRFFPALDAALEAITQGRQAPKDALDGAAARVLAR
jgi:maltose/maltodextrin transport system substrate-binding protein